MKRSLQETLRPALMTAMMMLLLCGLAYPLVLTGIGQVFFHDQANSSLITVSGRTVGAAHIGQAFTQPWFFKGRDSACHYNTYTESEKEQGLYTGPSSGGYNAPAGSPEEEARIEERTAAFLAEHPGISRSAIPSDLVTASGSGLDPDISPQAADIQIPAVAEASGLSQDELRQIVSENTTGKFLGIFGEAHVNVLKCNIAIAQKMGLL